MIYVTQMIRWLYSNWSSDGTANDLQIVPQLTPVAQMISYRKSSPYRK